MLCLTDTQAVADEPGTAHDGDKRSRQQPSQWSLDVVFEQMRDPVIITDVSRTIVNVNPAATRVFGYRRDELLGRQTVSLYADQNDHARIGRRAFAAEAETTPDEVVVTFKRKNGSTFKANLTGSSFRDANDQITGFFAIIHDITDYLELEEQRRASEALFETALETIPEGFVIFDENDRLVACNSAFRDLYEKSGPAMKKGARFEDILRYGIAHGQFPIAGTEPEEQEAWLTERLRQHKNPDRPMLQRVDDDRWLKVEEQKTERGYTVGIRFDVTDMKRSEEKLALANQGLKARTAALEEFAVIVSHDLQAPLRHLSIFADLLGENKTLEDDAKVQARQIGVSARRMQALVRSLLDYCILAYGKVNKRPTDFKNLVDSVIEGLCWTGPDAPVNVTVRSTETVNLDPDLMARVVQNIFENARKHCHQTVPHIEVDVGRDATGWIITIADDGIGIAAPYADRVFQMFRRLGGGQTDTGGMGVGLALCKQIVESHSGQIWLDTSYDQGARFVITLPFSVREPVLSVQDRP